MKTWHDNFDKFYKEEKKVDKEIIKNIIAEVKKYDVYDIIAKLSALNLIPENQNKATIIEPIIAAIITLPKEELTSEYKISMGKFKKIIQAMENMKMKAALDPPENAFIDRIMFYKNYNIFTGNNYIPGYILQSMINALYTSGNEFNIEFSKRASILINFILQISDYASKKANISLENLQKYNELQYIEVPDEYRLEELKECLVLDERIINYMLNDDKLIELLYSDFKDENIENILNLGEKRFFKKPFLKDNKGNVIILSVAILVPFLIHNIIKLAEEYGEKHKLIEIYNNTVWNECRKYFYRLGNERIKENSLNIELEKKSMYKEEVLRGNNKQVIIAIGLFDDGRNYNTEKIFDEYNNSEFDKLLEKRTNYIIRKLRTYVNDEDIFICIIYNSFGRSMTIKFYEKTVNKPICINPFELKCISINEKNEKFFLTRYISAKNKLIGIPQFFGELPYIYIYTKCKYSFYINDEFNPKNTILYLGAGDHIEYIVKALKEEDRHLVESYDLEFMEEVILQDRKRGIYLSENIDRDNQIISLIVEMANIKIWIYSEEVKNINELNIYYNIIDMISYWIGECKKIIENKEFIENYINIKINITGNEQEYFYDKEYNESIKNTVSIRKENNGIILYITPNTYYCFNRADNKFEKELLLVVLNEILNLTDEDYIKIDKIFLPYNKQKLYTLNYEVYPYFKPIINPKKRKVNENDINELLDYVGRYILSLNKWNYGIINEEAKNEITSLVVDYLYKLLQNKVEKISPCNLIEAIYCDLEEQIYYMMIFQKRNYSDTLCYPERKVEIWKDFNENQRVIMAAKFLMEYVTAQPPSGKEVLGEHEYEQLLAICSLIIEWAYNNDLFRYKIFNTPIEILKSDRLGIKKDEFNTMGQSLLNAKINEFRYRTIGKWEKIVVQEEFEPEELDEAFNFENGFTFKEFLRVCYNLILIGNEQKSEFKKFECENLVAKLKKQLKQFEDVKIQKILDYISLEKREDFLKPPDGFRKEDVYPWRFNRELSFIRRPLIKRNNEYIWGNRSVFHMTMFTMELIREGKFKAKSKEMNIYVGKTSKARGRAFNDSVFNILKTFPELIVDKNLKKINGKKILDERNNELGDIDIIYIYNKKKQIVVVEVKDFKLSRNPYEIYCEYREMFEDSKNKKSYSTKLRRRTEWVENHIEDVKQKYNLCGTNWKVYKAFIVNEHLVSNNLYEKNENIIAVSEISLKKLTDLK